MAVLTDRPAVAAPARPRRDRGARALASSFVGYAVLVFFGLVFLYPFVIQIGNSLKTEPDAAANPLSPIPDPVSLAGFERIFEGTNFSLWLGNSLLVTVLVTLGRVFFDSLAGYALGAALLATIPVAVLFVIFQRYFVRDANDGADKG
ncbi:hypothetical protein ACFY2R_11045 [Micromonospora olivasterospora]|uniref:Multiple sugar transport system permease protein n=1 Tax=Micromonospora olivasterospora TaxID=1880 RepID=A0A562ID55_MICOL|nr:hypothetical protein [Micromonospora olivasterospora]TWH68931.1 multiple sugar transport system permease protein [Micromonospora olivasterospora]